MIIHAKHDYAHLFGARVSAAITRTRVDSGTFKKGRARGSGPGEQGSPRWAEGQSLGGNLGDDQNWSKF